MKRQLLFAIIWLGTGCAFAQPAQSVGPGFDRQAAREQRRVDLRNALHASRLPDASASKADEAAPAARHLSLRELAEMREQLRQQQAANRHQTSSAAGP